MQDGQRYVHPPRLTAARPQEQFTHISKARIQREIRVMLGTIRVIRKIRGSSFRPLKSQAAAIEINL